MLKKIISFVIAVSVMMSSCLMLTAQAADSADNYKVLDTVLGVKIEASDFDTPVTRVELASTIIQVTNTELVKSGKAAFVDVPQKHESFVTINTVYTNGLMSGFDDGTFRPYETATSGDAVDMALKVLGYEPLVKAMNMNESQKRDLASSAGLFKGLGDGKLTKRTMGKLLLNLLNAKVVEPSGVGSTMTYKETDKSYLEKRTGYISKKGVIQAVGNASIFGASTVDYGECLIDGVRYSCKDVDMIQYLGLEITVILDNEGMNVIAVRNEREIKELTIDAEDITAYTDYTYAYETQSGSIKKVKIPSDARIVFNGSNMVYDENLMIPQDGNVRFVDTDNNGDYDVVMVSSAVPIKVGTYIEDDVLRDAIRNTNISIKAIDIECYLNGVAVGNSNIAVGKYMKVYPDVMEYETKNGVLLLKPSEDKCKYLRCEIVSETIVDGTVTSISGEGLSIDSKAYTYGKYIDNLITAGLLKKPTLSSKATLYVDDNNKIMNFDISSKFLNSDTIKYGYLIDCFKDDDDSMYIKLINEQATAVNIKTARKFKVNKEEKSFADLKNDSNVTNEKVFVNGVVKKQLIMYDLDENGDMKNMYIAYDYADKYVLDETGADTSAKNPRYGISGYVGYDDENFSLNHSSGLSTELYRFGVNHMYSFTDATVGFKVPVDPNNLKKYEVLLNNGKNFLNRNSSYNFKVYNANSAYEIGAYVIDLSQKSNVTRDAPLENTFNTYITGKKWVWDEEEGEAKETYEMKTWVNGVLQETNISCDDPNFADADTRMKQPFGPHVWSDLQVGDAILTNKAEDGSLASFTVMFAYDKLYNTDGSVNYWSTGFLESTYLLTISKVISISENGKIVFSRNGKEEYASYCVGSTERIALFENGKFSQITIDDVRVGDTIYTRSGDGQLREVVVFR